MLLTLVKLIRYYFNLHPQMKEEKLGDKVTKM